MVDHRISGVASLTTPTDGSHDMTLPASITLDPAGIDLFAAILHLVWVIKNAPSHVGVVPYLEAYLSARVSVSLDKDGVYWITHKDRKAPVVVRVDKEKPVAECVEVQTPSGVFARVDLDRIKLAAP